MFFGGSDEGMEELRTLLLKLTFLGVLCDVIPRWLSAEIDRIGFSLSSCFSVICCTKILRLDLPDFDLLLSDGLLRLNRV
jgi:hypothetical protein